MAKKTITSEEVGKLVPEVWQELSDYLKLRLTWKGVLKKANKTYDNFTGFSIFPSTETNWAFRDLRQDTNSGVVTTYELSFNPVYQGEDYTRFVLGHELIHMYRKLVIPDFNFLLQNSRLFGIFEEAYGDVISAKSVKDPKLRRKCFNKTCSYGVLEVAMLEDVMMKMNQDELRSFIKRPDNQKDVHIMIDEVMGLLLRSDREKWVTSFFGKKKTTS